ncbi:UDP-glucose 4-epimerase GalE [Phenylobacterium sp.]|uniref:UDP-glucose 4-epimerase GalE n=1 Tax=Phenylobacterium sp. TaxID=1871053 RepID=UPI00343DDA5D
MGDMDRGSKPAVLVTGGAGYIGAHTAKALHEQGFFPVVYDDLSSGFREAVRWGEFVHGDIRDARALGETIEAHAIKAVIHFAGLIEVGRSVVRPDLFWDINVGGTMSLLSAIRERGVDRLVFSSSAAVYGQGGRGPLETIPEAAPKAPASPYGDTKLACEWMIAAECRAYGLSAVALRYFNAAGADPSGQIGEAHEPETHLIPLAIAAAIGRGPALTVFGTDYDTPDGTCLRDYIHVNDLAAAHVAALNVELPAGRFEAANVGVGQGRSVLQVVEAVARAVGRPVPHAIGARRAGDPASLVADPGYVRELLGWSAQCSDLDRIVADALRWEAQPAYSTGGRAAGPTARTQPQ